MMKFEEHKFSKRFPAIVCALFVVHEPGATIGYTQNGNAIRSTTDHRGTAAAIILPDGRFWIGVCLCAPMDQFVKSVGRQKAIGRAYQSMGSYCAMDGGFIHHGKVTIIEAIDGKPIEPRVGDVPLLKAQLQDAIDEAKKQQQVVVTA